MALVSVTPVQNAYKTTELELYREEYIRIGKMFPNTPGDFEQRAREMEINFTNLDKKFAGKCYILSNEIYIDKSDWDDMPEENKEELFFHEATHCVFKYANHTEEGIMKAEGFFNPRYYRENYQDLMNDLFGCPALNCVFLDYERGKYDVRRTNETGVSGKPK